MTVRDIFQEHAGPRSSGAKLHVAGVILHNALKGPVLRCPIEGCYLAVDGEIVRVRAADYVANCVAFEDEAHRGLNVVGAGVFSLWRGTEGQA